MQLTYDVLLILHIICWAIVIGGWLTSMRDPRVLPGVFHGVLGALVTGVAMTGIASASDSVDDVDNAKIGVKLIVALAVAVLAYIGQREREHPSRRSSTPSARSPSSTCASQFSGPDRSRTGTPLRRSA